MSENVEEREAIFWDNVARKITDDELRVSEAGQDELTRHQLDLLGDVKNRRVLEVGCGTGAWACMLALRGAEVWAIDISPESVAQAARASEINNVSDKVHASVMSAMNMSFDSNFFDIVHGADIIHHLDADVFGKEVARVLKPDGKAIFSENCANNPILMFARNTLCGRFGIPKWSSDDEYPLTTQKKRQFAAPFAKWESRYPVFLFFFYFNAKVFKYRVALINTICSFLDRSIYTFLPFLRRYSYRQILLLSEPAGRPDDSQVP